MQLPQTTNNEKPIIDSYFPVFSFLLIILFVPLILLVMVSQITKFGNAELAIIWGVLFLIISIITSYFVLYRVRIYSTWIEVYYFVKHNSKRNKVIKNEEIVKVVYKYVNGRGAHSVLKIYFTENGTNRSIDYAGNSTQSIYAKAIKNFINHGVNVEIDPSWALSEYGL
jgi:hypothetical protein